MQWLLWEGLVQQSQNGGGSVEGGVEIEGANIQCNTWAVRKYGKD